MVELGHKNGRSTTPAEAIKSAVADAVASGMGTDEIQSMVQTALPDNLANFEELVPVYNKTPEGMIDLASAKEKYGYSRQLLAQWLERGKLRRVAFLKNPISGNDIPLYYETDFNSGTAHRSKEDRIYDEVPLGLIDLRAAAEKYACPISKLHNWVHTEKLQSHGRLKAPAPGGGYLLVSEFELIKKLALPPNKGGRPRKI